MFWRATVGGRAQARARVLAPANSRAARARHVRVNVHLDRDNYWHYYLYKPSKYLANKDDYRQMDHIETNFTIS